jgi:hypothetical protein
VGAMGAGVGVGVIGSTAAGDLTDGASDRVVAVDEPVSIGVIVAICFPTYELV